MRNLGQNNHIVNLLKASAAISFSIFLTACGDDSNKTSGGSVEDQEVIAISDKTISGVSQKGPFVNGSSVTVQELDGETLAQTGNSYEGKIKNDLGEFSVKVTKLASQYALLKANGFYRNEVSGEKSKSQVTLYAFTDLSDRDEVNVNLLTHLEYERSIYLATEDSMSVDSAKKLAEKEVLNSFGINGEFASAEDLNIFGNGDESAALLAISVLMQGDLKEADFTERLNNYAMDIETDGIWNDSITATVIADWASDKSLKGELEAIRQNIAEWKISEDVPDFEKYVNNYWWENYRLGVCNDKREGEVLQNSNAQSKKYKEFLICKNNAWRIASDLEYDTYEQKCDEDGKIIFGNVNKDQPYDCDGESWRKATEVEGILGGCIEKRFDEVAEALEKHYICEKREWRAAKDIEKDTYKWKDGKDADSKYGDVVKSNCYVYEDSSWRSGNEKDCALDLRGCTMLRQDTVGKGSDKVWYICDAKSWRNATTYEKDTFGWTDSTDGAIKKGNVTDTVYVFDRTAWRTTSNIEAKLGGCVGAIADSVGKVGSTYYICKSNRWVEASAIEYDTYRWTAGKDGDSKTGSVNANNCYVYENSIWRNGGAKDCSLGLRGCTALRQDTVGKGSDKVWYICDTKNWRNATTYEKDTFGWKDSTDGAIKKGNVSDTIYVFDKTAWRTTNNVEAKLGGCVGAIADSVGKVGSTYYICKSNNWVEASAIEYDTYRWAAGKDGDSKPGSVNANNCYVYENSIWRNGGAKDCSLGLRGCTALRQDTVGKGSDKVWYICDTKNWRNATTYEKDTFGWKDSTDGAIKKGNVSDTIYVFDKTAWRTTNNVEAKLGGCVGAIADSVGKVGSTYYICKSNNWVEASAIEYDTYRWAAGKDGDSKLGSVNANNCYVYENSIWRNGGAKDCSLGLRGCTSLRQDTVGFGADNIWYKCVSRNWRTATNIEKDTAAWGAGAFDGEVRTGQINKTTYYIYGISSNAWRNATTIEIDTYDYANNTDWTNGADGEIKKGAITDTIYVFDATGWRIADDIEKVLGGCVASIRDSVGKVDNTYYICDPRKWNVATALQYDTYKRECSRDGKIFNGNVNTTVKYVCDNENFRLVDSLEIVADSACTSYNRDVYYIPSRVLYYDEVYEMLKVEKNYSYYKCESTGWTFTTEKLNQGVMTDLRDNHIYKTIGIKSQIWMAENLNYADSVTYPSMLKRNWCYENESDNCEKYGRLYTWSAVIDSVYWSRQNKECGYRNNEEYEDNITCGLPNKVQGICPNGWSVPSDSAWFVLLHNVRHYKTEDLLATGSSVGGTVGWKWKNATDKFGFSILATGVYYNGRYNEGVEISDFQFLGMDSLTYFWHSTEYNCCNAGYGDFSYYGSILNNAKYNGFSVRCIKDDDLP